MAYEIDLGFSIQDYLDHEELDTPTLEQVAGLSSESSGAGFGIRDIQFTATSRRAAREACETLRKYFDQIGVELEYINYYWQEPWWVFNLRPSVIKDRLKGIL